MTDVEYYKRSVELLDNFLGESQIVCRDIQNIVTWRDDLLFKLFKQAVSISYSLLSNTIGSRFQRPEYVTELSLIGTHGRLIRDIYVKIVYLKTAGYSEEEKKLCWDYQIVTQKINLLKHEKEFDDKHVIEQLEFEKGELGEKLKLIKSSTIGKILDGKEDMLIGLKELANIKGFSYDRFYNEFVFFSQFSHTTAYANSFHNNDGFPIAIIALVLNKIVSYYLAVVVESIDHLKPDHHQMSELHKLYQEIIVTRWG